MAPGSEDLLWLRDNAQQLSAEMRTAATNDLAPLTRIPHVSNGAGDSASRIGHGAGLFRRKDTTFSEAHVHRIYVWRLRKLCLSSFTKWAPWYRR